MAEKPSGNTRIEYFNEPDNDQIFVLIQVQDVLITGGDSCKLNVFKLSNNQCPIQTLEIKDCI